MLIKKVIAALHRGDLGAGLRRGLMNSVVASSLVPKRVRVLLMRLLGIKIGRSVLVMPGIRFVGTDVVLEDGVGVNSGVIFDHGARIHLEQNVRVAFNVIFACAGHEFGPPEMRAADWYAKPIRVGKGTWIGANAIIMPGVSIAPGCVIAANSFVNADLQTPNTLYVGAPARALRELDSPRTDGDLKAG